MNTLVLILVFILSTAFGVLSNVITNWIQPTLDQWKRRTVIAFVICGTMLIAFSVYNESKSASGDANLSNSDDAALTIFAFLVIFVVMIATILRHFNNNHLQNNQPPVLSAQQIQGISKSATRITTHKNNLFFRIFSQKINIRPIDSRFFIKLTVANALGMIIAWGVSIIIFALFTDLAETDVLNTPNFYSKLALTSIPIRMVVVFCYNAIVNLAQWIVLRQYIPNVKQILISQTVVAELLTLFDALISFPQPSFFLLKILPLIVFVFIPLASGPLIGRVYKFMKWLSS